MRIINRQVHNGSSKNILTTNTNNPFGNIYNTSMPADQYSERNLSQKKQNKKDTYNFLEDMVDSELKNTNIFLYKSIRGRNLENKNNNGKENTLNEQNQMKEE